MRSAAKDAFLMIGYLMHQAQPWNERALPSIKSSYHPPFKCQWHGDQQRSGPDRAHLSILLYRPSGVQTRNLLTAWKVLSARTGQPAMMRERDCRAGERTPPCGGDCSFRLAGVSSLWAATTGRRFQTDRRCHMWL